MSLAYIRILALRIHRCTLIWGLDSLYQSTWKLLFVYNIKHSVGAKFNQSRGQHCVHKWQILNAYSLWRICLGLRTSNLWGKKDNFNEWSFDFMQYTFHFNASSWNQQNQPTIHCKIENPYSLKLWDELTLILLLWSTFDHTWCLLLWWSMLFIWSKSRWRSKMIGL